MHPVFIQAFYYGILMVITIGLTGFFLKGFFFKYVKVRLSFGRLIMVKVRTTMRDYFATGWVEDGFLVYKCPHKSLGSKKDEVRIAVDTDDRVIYRCLAVTWVDVDEEKNAISSTDYKPIDGFDSKKFSGLLTRALMRPAIESNKEKIIFFGIIIAVIVAAAAAYLSFMNLQNSQMLLDQLPGMIKEATDKAIVMGGSQNI